MNDNKSAHEFNDAAGTQDSAPGPETTARPLPDSVLERFRTITFPEIGNEVLKKIAEKMVEKSDTTPAQKDALRKYVEEDILKDYDPSQGARGMQKQLKLHIKALAKTQKEESRKANAVITSLTSGTSRKITALRTARFRRNHSPI